MSVTLEDKQISLSRWLESALKIQILNDDETVLDELNGFNDMGSITTDASSYTRRTFSFTLFPTDQDINVGEHSRVWINKQAKVLLGLKTPRMSDFTWYECGVFIFNDTSSTYNQEDNTLTVNCSDRMAQLDGTTNGELGALKTTIPAYDEDANGNPTHYYTIRDALQNVITQLGNVKRYVIDEIGEYYGTPYNPNYIAYRTSHPEWNYLPYDLEYSAGSNVGNILTELIELYPNYDAAFDESGVLKIGMIPSCIEDDIILTNDDIQEVLVNESCSTTLSSIRNVVHVWGQTFEVDWYADTSTNSSNVYHAVIDKYDGYYNGDLVAIKVPSTNSATQKININKLGEITIYDEGTDRPIDKEILTPAATYVFKYNRGRFYLQGQWQAHALSVLVDGTESEKYSKKYFQDKYQTETVSMKEIADSPYTVQKIGERLSTKSGDVYDNISSDSLAVIRADDDLRKLARLTDNITIEVSTLMPWLKEYMKVSYQKKNESEIKQYITDTVTLNLSEGTTTITMHTFYPLYE